MTEPTTPKRGILRRTAGFFNPWRGMGEATRPSRNHAKATIAATQAFWQENHPSKLGTPTRLESFEDAMARLDLTEGALQRRRHELATMSTVFYVLAIVAIFLGVYQALTHSPFIAAVCVLWAGAFVFNGVAKGWRVYQIDQRRFVRFGDAVRHLKCWLP